MNTTIKANSFELGEINGKLYGAGFAMGILEAVIRGDMTLTEAQEEITGLRNRTHAELKNEIKKEK